MLTFFTTSVRPILRSSGLNYLKIRPEMDQKCENLKLNLTKRKFSYLISILKNIVALFWNV